MKKVYIVRHGQSIANLGPRNQINEDPLSEIGREQANVVADRCVKLPIEVIISSTMTRAKETAEIINSQIDKPLEFSELFLERKRPSEIYGKQRDDFKAMSAEKEIIRNFHLPNYRFSNEENFDDLKVRALKALDYLAQRKEENILVVTHGFFMRIVMGCVVIGEELTGEQGSRFIRTFHMENTGLTILEHDPKQPAPWWLWVWNDHAHLG